MGTDPSDGIQKPPQLPSPTRQHSQASTSHGLSPQSSVSHQLPHHQQQLQLNPTSQSPLQLQQLQQQQQQQQRSVKRPRPVKSCTECRKRKLRCDRLLPCSQCQKSSRICKYAADQDSANLSDGSEIETSDTTRPMKRHCQPGSALTPNTTGNEAAPATTHSRNGDGTGSATMEDLSVRMDRLEKQVLVVRSPAPTDMSSGRVTAAPADTIRGLTVKDNAQKTRYFGQITPRVMMNLFDDAKAFLRHSENIRGAKDMLVGFKTLHSLTQSNYRQALAPITVFVDSMMPVQKRMRDILPRKEVCDKLVKTYIDTSETLYRILHIPSFTRQYELYWEGKLQSEKFLPQLLSVLATASRFETKSGGLGHERSAGVHIPTACALVRTWLEGLRGKQLIDFTTLQVEVLLVHAQRMLTPRPHELWTQLGYIVRQAMTMGMHRDPSEFGSRLPIFQGELRRRLFYTILDMDLHNSLSSNCPSLLREGDFTCRPPRNLDDVELFEGMLELPQSRPIDQLTDNQMQVHAATTLPARMKVVHLVNRIDTVRDYQEVLEIGSKLDRYLEDINFIYPRQGGLDDAQRSKLWRSRVILDMHVRRPLLALYRPLAMGSPDAPAQVSRAYLRSCMVILKYLDEIDPRLPHFPAVTTMYHQLLKLDIIQCALSVCYYIQLSTRPNTESTLLGQAAMRMTPDCPEDFPEYTASHLQLWSLSGLIGTVEKTIELLINHMGGGDTKDILYLVLALECVRSSNLTGDEVVRGCYAALDACLRSSNLTMDKLHAASRAAVDKYNPGGYGHDRIPPSQEPMPMSNFGSWIIWDGWE